MKKFNYIKLTIQIISFYVISSQVIASNHNTDACSFRGFQIGLDFLYWKPSIDHLDFAAVTLDDFSDGDVTFESSTTKYKAINTKWEPGTRIRLSKKCNSDWRISASYTIVNIKNLRNIEVDDVDESISSPLLHPLFAFARLPYNFAEGLYQSRYQTWDTLLSYNICTSSFAMFSPFFGLEGLLLDQNLAASYLFANNTGSVQWQSHYHGTGLKAGATCSINIFKCLKAFGTASTSLIMGTTDSHQNQQVFFDLNNTLSEKEFIDDDTNLIIPGFHLQLGLKYEGSIFRKKCEFSVGWEFIQWHNVPNQRSFSGFTNTDIAISTSPSERNYGFQGLFFGLDLSF